MLCFSLLYGAHYVVFFLFPVTVRYVLEALGSGSNPITQLFPTAKSEEGVFDEGCDEKFLGFV
jgi:hypothetical protein